MTGTLSFVDVSIFHPKICNFCCIEINLRSKTYFMILVTPTDFFYDYFLQEYGKQVKIESQKV